MPFSDDLYSPDADHFDAEAASFSEELSPTDGYFGGETPSNAMVPDPSLRGDDKTVEDKVLITRPGPRAGSGSSPGPSNTPTLQDLHPPHRNASAPSPAHVTSSPNLNDRASRSSNRVHPDVLIMGAHTPPPAYSPSPSLPTSPTATSPPPQSPLDTRNYNTFSQRRLEQHLEQGFRPSREPDSMGRPEDDPNELSALANIRIKKRSYRRAILQKLLLTALLFVILAPVLTAMFKWTDSGFTKNPYPKQPPHTDPYFCSSATYTKDPITYEFPVDSDVSVVQTTQEHHGNLRDYQQVQTVGTIRLRRLDKNSNHGNGKGYTTVDIKVSHPDLEVQWKLDEGSRFLTVSTPRYARLDSPGPQCISLDIVVWLPEDAKLTNLFVSSITLGLKVLDDLKVVVSEESRLATVSGNVLFPSSSLPTSQDLLLSHPQYRFHSRRVDVETVSGDISGLYPLLDYLGLASQSGSVKVGVWPHDALPSDPAPADLEIHTASGDIDVHLPAPGSWDPDYTPPPRDYISKVISISGDITGTYYLGSSGEFKTGSGDFKVKILPILESGSSGDPDKDPKVGFKTETISGSTKVEILDPIFISPTTQQSGHENDSPARYQPIGDEDPYILHPGGKLFSTMVGTGEKKLRNLQSSHVSKSGDIVVYYPGAWEGSVTGKTFSGDIKAEGKELKVVKSKKGIVHKEILARKGVDSGAVGSFATLEAISGDLHFIAASSKS